MISHGKQPWRLPVFESPQFLFTASSNIANLRKPGLACDHELLRPEKEGTHHPDV
jgi:hypothetical protein